MFYGDITHCAIVPIVKQLIDFFYKFKNGVKVKDKIFSTKLRAPKH